MIDLHRWDKNRINPPPLSFCSTRKQVLVEFDEDSAKASLHGALFKLNLRSIGDGASGSTPKP
jgi:hypothetical protein